MGINGEHILLTQGARQIARSAGRSTSKILATPPSCTNPTPLSNSAFQNYTTYSNDLGGGTIDTGHVYTATAGPAANKTWSLLTIVEHETMAPRGSSSRTSPTAKTLGNTLEIMSPLRCAGTTMFMFTGHLDMSQLPHALMSNIQPPGERILISTADVLTEAEEIEPVPEPQPRPVCGAGGVRGRPS